VFTCAIQRSMQADMIAYYRRRAGEYEHVYAKPERQRDLGQLRAVVGETFTSHHVLEVSCGTGYWTEVLAPSADSVVACDINPEVLEIARGKPWGATPVEFRQADSYALPDFGRSFSAGYSGFWWSHVPKRSIATFLDGFHARLERRAKVMFIDNRYVEGSSTPISRVDDAGNSFQERRLADGSVHEVLKNFPSTEELLQHVAGVSARPEVVLTPYYWILRYETV
jgi:SAM-dependent methyltransferase